MLKQRYCILHKLTESILKGIQKIAPQDYFSLGDFCTSIANSIQKVFDIEQDGIHNTDMLELDFFHLMILEHLKKNQNIEWIGTGTFSSVFFIKNTDKAFKINIASCDSYYDSWLSYAKKIINTEFDNPWLPKIHFLIEKENIYAAIVDKLSPVSINGKHFQKNIIGCIRNIIEAVEKADFKKFKSEESTISAILEQYENSHVSSKILKAIELILSVQRSTKSIFDIYPQNIMIDRNLNIIINDPLSYNNSLIEIKKNSPERLLCVK